DALGLGALPHRQLPGGQRRGGLLDAAAGEEGAGDVAGQAVEAIGLPVLHEGGLLLAEGAESSQFHGFSFARGRARRAPVTGWFVWGTGRLTPLCQATGRPGRSVRGPIHPIKAGGAVPATARLSG